MPGKQSTKKAKRQKRGKPWGAWRFRMSEDELVRRINKLPKWTRVYLHEIASWEGPAGSVRTIADLREQVEALTIRVEELRRELRRAKRKAKRINRRGRKGQKREIYGLAAKLR